VTIATEKLSDVVSTIDDLVAFEPKSYGNDKQASEAAAWVLWAKNTEGEVEALLDPEIKKANDAHKALTGQKKTLLAKLLICRDRVRVNLANWIAGGNKVKGCYIKSKWLVDVKDEKKLPDEYFIITVDHKKLDEWATKTEGKVAIAGCEIRQINVLYSSDKE
jgi:hypothetical protein